MTKINRIPKKRKESDKKTIETFSSYLSSNSISSYMNEIDKVPLLKREEEVELAKLIEQGDEKARETMIVSNLRFVVSVAKKYQGMGLPLSDLISEGNVGLIEAVSRFDYRRGYHFISYAIWWIRQSITKAISEKSRMVRLPMNRNHEVMQIWKYVDSYVKDNGKRPDEKMISEKFNISKEEINKMMDLSQGHTSIDEMIQDQEGGEYSGYSHYFSDTSNSPDDLAVNYSLNENIGKLLSRLSDRERTIIEYRFGLNGEEPQSLSEIGSKLNLTKERIRQIEKLAMDTIRNFQESQDLSAYLSA